MIRLKRGPKPHILEEKGEEWKQTLLQKLHLGTLSPTEKNRYRHPDIKAALVTETHGKCAYCESKLRHIHHGDVEHVYPKSLNPDLTFDWENLTLACEICNQNKSDRDPEHSQIIDAYMDEPDQHLFFLGPFIFATGTPKGVSTRLLLELDRAELIERRKERLDKIASILSNITRNDLPIEVRKAILRNLRETDASNASEYSAMVRTAISEFLRHLPTELQTAIAA
jgi:CRISPR/Cas system Type II protein with McrA/HNH and RuvC-like nuclease domain